jgi:septal ring-binding cell division protein DamX
MGTRDQLLKEKIEVSLDGRQVFYLLGGATVLLALVFALGVVIGRRVEARLHHSVPAEVGQDPLAALDQLEARGKSQALLFPETLSGDREVIAAVDEKLEAKPEEPKAETAVAPVSPPAPTPPPAPAAGTAAAPVAVPVPAAEPEPVPTPEKKKQTVAPVKKDKAATGGKFTLQLSSFQERGEAEQYAQRLKESGFLPYIAEAKVAGKGTFYRVRVGKYPTFQDAVEGKAAFEKKQKTIAYVTRIAD